MAWIICPNEICGERFALSDDTEAFARAHEGLRLVCPFGHAIWPFPAPSEAVKPLFDGAEVLAVEKPKNTRKRVLPVTEAEQAALDEPEEPTHAPTPEEVAAEAKEAAELVLGPQPDATAAESPAEPDAAASPAYEDGTETEAGSEAITADIGPEESDDAASEEVDNDSLPPELQALITATETVDSWDAVKEALRVWVGTDLCKSLSPDQQNHIRRSTWETLVDRNLDWLPDHHHDLSAFRLWLEAADDGAAIRAALALLQADPAAQAKTAALQSVATAAAARLADLG